MIKNFIVTKIGLIVIVLSLPFLARANEQLPSDVDTPCPPGYSKGYSGYSYYCYSDVIKKTIDSKSPDASNSCPVGYQLSYSGYSYQCELVVCVKRSESERQPLPSSAEEQCPTGYRKNYWGYSYYCVSTDVVVPCSR